MTEAASTPTTPPPIGKIADAVHGLEEPLMEIRCVVSLLEALTASEVTMQPEALCPVHDGLKRAHAAADAAFRAALDLLKAAPVRVG